MEQSQQHHDKPAIVVWVCRGEAMLQCTNMSVDMHPLNQKHDSVEEWQSSQAVPYTPLK